MINGILGWSYTDAATVALITGIGAREPTETEHFSHVHSIIRTNANRTPVIDWFYYSLITGYMFHNIHKQMSITGKICLFSGRRT